MASSSSNYHDLSPEPDLHPIFPSIAQISILLSSHSGLTPEQKSVLVSHCMRRSCVFGELSILQYLLHDPQAQPFVDLATCDEDGLGLVSLAIHGFGSESDRDVEREECVRLLISQGADLSPDNAGWTPLHHAALLSPPTLISYLMTHGCSPFAKTRRSLTPLDIVTAHSVLPGREDVALLLEEAMRGEGWTGGKMEERRRLLAQRKKQRRSQSSIRRDVGKVLGVSSSWWGSTSEDSCSESESDEETGNLDNVYTPPADYASMLVFSLSSLPQIFETLIINFRPAFRDARPANALYLLARFACLTCDHNWLEDLIVGATDAIEEAFFNQPDDLTCQIFWLYNTTIWLHLLQCDTAINEACEMLGSFDLIEEVINSVFVFIIRFAERGIDQLLDAAILEYTSPGSQHDEVQFESEWSFLRSFTSKKKTAQPRGNALSPPASPLPNIPHSSSVPTSAPSKGFSTLRQNLTRPRAPSAASPLHSLFSDASPSPALTNLISFLSALHTLLSLSDVNPALIAQLWSQVLYWTSCELFNRILTRKKYLCRSKAAQIDASIAALEEWILDMQLPPGLTTHFVPIRELLQWLQRLSSITEFAELVAIIQTLKNINPLQMRRAVRDYKYEINEGRMTDECAQYLTQLQKDWERHRVKLGVEALRKEIVERDRDLDESVTSASNNSPESNSVTLASLDQAERSPQNDIDLLFDSSRDKPSWEPPKAPQALGELLDSRYMLPLYFPRDPRLLAVLPGKLSFSENDHSMLLASDPRTSGPTGFKPSNRQHWRSRSRKIRDVGLTTLKCVDGATSSSRWGMFHDHDDAQVAESASEVTETPLTRQPSLRSKGRSSTLGDHMP